MASGGRRWSSETGHTVPSLFDLHKTVALYLCLAIGATLALGCLYELGRSHRLGDTAYVPATRGTAGGPSFHPRLPVSIRSARSRRWRWRRLAIRRADRGRSPCRKMQQASIRVGRESAGIEHVLVGTDREADQYSGAILDVRAPRYEAERRETFIDWQWPRIRGRRSGCPAACSCAPAAWPVR